MLNSKAVVAFSRESKLRWLELECLWTSLACLLELWMFYWRFEPGQQRKQMRGKAGIVEEAEIRRETVY